MAKYVHGRKSFIEGGIWMNIYLKGVDLSTATATHKNEILHIYEWWADGKCHRDDGPAYIDEKRKIYEWRINDQLHRVVGPADIDEINKRYAWFVDDDLHRDDGPAIIYEKSKIWQWYINGVNKTEEIIKWLDDHQINWQTHVWSIEEKVLFKVIFG